jgi:hypothetical protein
LARFLKSLNYIVDLEGINLIRDQEKEVNSNELVSKMTITLDSGLPRVS